MSSIAIRAQGLGKLYRLGRERRTHETFREALLALPRRVLTRERRAAPTIWALRDASFEIGRGEVVGVIGHNGAGKSTLLKVLSRITPPTSGRADTWGRVGSLLEVGTGFHPELTGRENVFLNGAVLGMFNAEIKRKFDEIVAFAGVEPFMDTPVKRYSSGMYLRLAFSVAAHFEPEILIVDEVLAVGDLQFQRKCLGKMEEVAATGRTVLFVSHNLAAITRLCQRCLLLHEGRIDADGEAKLVVAQYLSRASAGGSSRTWSPELAPGSNAVRLRSVVVKGGDDLPASVVAATQPVAIEIAYDVLAPVRFRCSISLSTQGVCAFSSVEPFENDYERAGSYRAALFVPPNLLAEGEYVVGVSLFGSHGVKARMVVVREAVTFQVTDAMRGDSARGDYAEAMAGVVRPKLEWRRSLDASRDAADAVTLSREGPA